MASEQPLEQHAETAVAHDTSKHSRSSGLLDEDAHAQVTRWWVISSAFPMLASTLGPVASAFSLCALVRDWLQYYPAGSNVDDAVYLPDPVWLRVINGIQLLLALIANIALYLNMAGRMRYTVAQPIAMFGWYISFICLVTLLATAAGPAYRGKEHTDEVLIWSQSFFYGIWAAILYFMVASLVTITFWARWSGHHVDDMSLTTSQRTLMLQTISFLLHLMIGALVFSVIEDWPYLDGVYWAEVTLLTVGFGDYTVTTTLGRGLLFPYALSGIVSLGLVIASIRSLVLQRAKRCFDARVEEKSRRKAIGAMTRKGDSKILTPLRPGPEAGTDPSVPRELARRLAEFEVMRAIQKRAVFRLRWGSLIESTCSWLVLMLVGAVVFHRSEEAYQHWTFADSMYFCYISLMTIGYGDFAPVSNAGKSFFVFWSILAVPTTTVLISTAGHTVISLIRNVTIQLGNLTILPGSQGFVEEIRELESQIASGVGANSGRREARGSGAERPVENGSSHAQAALSRRRRPASRAASDVAYDSLCRIDHKLSSVPTGRGLQITLISEIRKVLQQSREDTPRQYKFEEWAWYLGLMGEDERDPDRHLETRPDPRHHRQQTGQGERRHGDQKPEDERRKWSWVDSRNPLLTGREESEWILDRLVDRLEELLETGTI